MKITHQSDGGYGSDSWGSTYVDYARKWCPDSQRIPEPAGTPAHDASNPDLKALMPIHAQCIVEVGCSRGALARDYRRSHSCSHYIGIEIDSAAAEVARRHCTEVLHADIESLSEERWESLFPSDLWIFGDSLEHLRDPWSLLRRLRQRLDWNASIVACVPNAQHWSLQARLARGDFFYEDQGLLDRTHLRWFTRRTAIHLFESTGYAVEAFYPRLFAEPQRDVVLPGIRHLAQLSGGDAEDALKSCLPLQYILQARPI